MTLSLQEQIKKALDLLNKKYLNSPHEKRLNHIMGVATTAKSLAEKYNVDIDRAYLAGLMHDYYRYEDINEMSELLDDEEIKICEEFPVLYHNFASAEAYLKLIGNDKEIYEAIKYHTFGKPNMTKLEEIILISDYIEPSRVYKDCIKCRNLVERSLFYTAIYESTKHTIDFVLNEGKNIHPYQYEVLNCYKEKMLEDLLLIIKEALNKVRAQEVKIYETKETSPFYDYIIISTITNTRSSEAIKSYLEDYITDTPFNIRSTEGEGSSWLLIDLNNVILSIFTKEERDRLDIDKLYSNLRIKESF